MDCLPQELMKMVVDEVAHKDDSASREALKGLRLLNRMCNVMASPMLFQTVGLWLGLGSLQNLTNISDHPEISRMVECIRFSPLRFVGKDQHLKWSPSDPSFLQIKTVGELESDIREWLSRECSTLNGFDIAYGQHAAASAGYLEGQRYLITDSIAHQLLTRAFKSLPNLTRVDIDPNNRLIGAKELVSAFGQIHGPELIYDGDDTLLPLFEGLYLARVHLKELAIIQKWSVVTDDRFSACPTHPSQPPAMLPVIDGSRSYDRSLSNMALSVSFRAMHDLFNRQGPWGLSSDIESVTFANPCLAENDPAVIAQLITAFKKFTSTLKISKLREFRFESIRDFENRLHKPCLSYLVDLTALQRLRTLCLSNVVTPEIEVVDLIRSMKDTLATAKFRSCMIIDDGHWASALAKMRTNAFAALRSFTLECCDDDCQECVEAADYLLKKTDQKPTRASAYVQS